MQKRTQMHMVMQTQMLTRQAPEDVHEEASNNNYTAKSNNIATGKHATKEKRSVTAVFLFHCEITFVIFLLSLRHVKVTPAIMDDNAKKLEIIAIMPMAR